VKLAPLVIVLPVCRPDFHQAIKWLRWQKVLLSQPGSVSHDLVIFHARSVENELVAKLHKEAEGWLGHADIVSNPEFYEQPELGYAAMANQMFRAALEYTEAEYPGAPTLWCEPDCIPTNPKWSQQIEQEYIHAGMPFMGDFHGPGKIPHMTGNGVYHPDWRNLAPSIAELPNPNPEQGWDSQCAHDTLPQSHHSYRIQQEWIVPPILFTEKTVGLLHHETALFHRDKTGTLIDVLCARIGADPIWMDPPVCTPSPVQPSSQPLPGKPKRGGVHILIVSCARDAEMCSWLLRSLKQNAKGFAGITLMVPVQDVKSFRHIPEGVTFTTFDEMPAKGFLHHEIQICRADEICPDADFIVHIDSDCLVWREMTPEDFVQRGKCLLVREHYDLIAPRNPNRLIWKTCVERCTGLSPEYDYMVRHPQVYPRVVYGALRAAVERYTGMGFERYVFGCENGWPQGFAEFPALGTVGSIQFPDAFRFVDYDHKTDRHECGVAGVDHQYLYRPERDALVEGWSHGGFARYRTDWEKFMAGDLPKFYKK